MKIPRLRFARNRMRSRCATSRNLIACLALFACFAFTFSSPSFAMPWVKVGDERTRHHLLYLRDTGAINLPLSSWPVNWADISREMAQMHLDDLNPSQVWSYRYLRHELDRAKRGKKTKKQFHASNHAMPFTNFASDTREKASIESQSTFMTERFALNIEAQTIHNPFDDDRYTMDGSFAAVTLGNWIVGIGNIERWWGPGWESNLILGNSARPTTGVFAKRLESFGAGIPVLSLLGPWSFEIFASELEEERSISKPSLFAGRFVTSPLQQLELGVSLSSISGGELNEGFGANSETEERFELFSYDARLNLNLKKATLAFYGQLLEKSESKNREPEVKPSTILGAEFSFVFKRIHNRFMFEVSDTEGELNNGVVLSHYDDPYYQNGYRFKGRNIADSSGGNAKKSSVSADHFTANGHQLSWRVSNITINESGPSQNTLGVRLIEQHLRELEYKFPFNDMTQIGVGAFQLSETLDLAGEKVGNGANITITIRI